MKGICLNQPINYKYASFRYFAENEHHVTRICPEDVLLLVFDGILRFSENGIPYEISAGEYHIQQHDSIQTGEHTSSSPKYLYVHFLANWKETEGKTEEILPFQGSFSVVKLKKLMEQLDLYAHNEYTMVECEAVFFEIISRLFRSETQITIGKQIAEFIEQNFAGDISLRRLSEEFHFSKNHIINLFRKEYGITPIQYVKSVRIREAQRLLEATSKNAEVIAQECGFQDYSYFYKLFREKNGTSPVQWRIQKRLKPYDG